MSRDHIPDYSWQEGAPCLSEDTRLFYPERGEVVPDYIKKMCEECPLKERCIEHAVKHEYYGYWGGTSERERRRMRRVSGIRGSKPETGAWDEAWDDRKGGKMFEITANKRSQRS
jgi:WhiB family redox-sensing transcriptional regulator